MAFKLAVKGIRGSLLWFVALLSLLITATGQAASPAASYKVGMREVDWRDGERPMVMTLFYPAEISDPTAKPTAMPFFVNLQLSIATRPLPRGTSAFPSSCCRMAGAATGWSMPGSRNIWRRAATSWRHSIIIAPTPMIPRSTI